MHAIVAHPVMKISNRFNLIRGDKKVFAKAKDSHFLTVYTVSMNFHINLHYLEVTWHKIHKACTVDSG